MTDKHLKTIELPKVLELLAKECSCADTAEMALELTPVTGIWEVKESLAASWDAHMLIGKFGTPSLGGVRNPAPPLRRAQAGGVLSMAELLRIAEVLRIVRALKEWRSRCEGIVTRLDPLFMALQPNKFLEEKISSSIISEDEMSDNASRELADIRRKKRAASSRVREQLDKMIRSQTYQKYLQDSIVTIRGGRFVVPVKSEHRGSVPGLVHDTSSSGATVFIEPMGSVEANNEIKVLESREAAEIERILFELSSGAGDFADTVIASFEALTQIDLLFAKARLGYSMKAGIPEVNDRGFINLKGARHPLIDKNKVVATDIILGDKFDTLLITGPNTGGKTVTLKTIGLLTAMALCGLLIPARDGSSISVFDAILADIGDEQSIEQSLSTFSAHIKNIIDIIDVTHKENSQFTIHNSQLENGNYKSDHKYLVLMDELGAGTDPVEGAALAMAIIEALRANKAQVVLAATTHYAELKSYAVRTPGVENGCCEFDVATLRPTYRLLIGVPGRSNAFAISQRLGLPEDVVNRAQELVSGESARFEETIEALEKSRQILEGEQEKARKLRENAEKAHETASAQQERLSSERERILEQARGEAARVVSQAKAQSAALLSEMDALRKEMKNTGSFDLHSKAKSEMRSRIRQMEQDADPIQESESDGAYVLPRPLKIGDTVILSDIGKQAVVLRLPDKTGQVEVQAGIMKTRVKVSQLRLLEQEVKINNKSYQNKSFSPENQKSGRSIEDGIKRSAVTEVDLRGMSVDEGVMEVDKAIDSAVLQNLSEIRAVHGKGTGALRAGLHQHFKRHPNIKSFRLGIYGEGESGVTILELK